MVTLLTVQVRAHIPGFGVALALLGCGPKEAPTPPEDPEPSLGQAVATPESLCEEGGRTWSVLGENGPAARTRGRCLGKEARGWHFVSQLHPTGADAPSQELHLWLGRDGNPRHAQLREPLRVTHYRWDDGAIEIRLHGDIRKLEPVDDTPVWVLPRHAVYLRELMFRLGVGRRDPGALQLGFVPSRDEIVPLPLRVEPGEETVLARANQGSFELDPGAARTWGSLRISRGLTAEGTVVYEQADGPTAWDPALPEVPLPTYTLPDDLMSVPVTIPAADGHPALAGELVARKDADAGPHCGVAFLSGSGPQDRFGFVPNTSIDTGSHEIHDALARTGCIVLRFDDRGTGASETGPTDAGYRALVEDGRRALRVLANRPEVDPARIALVGHSEGAITAVLLANEKVRVGRRKHALAGVVAMGLVGRSLREVIYSQVRAISRGKPEAEIEKAVTDARAIHDRLMAGETPAEVAPVANWMREIFAVDPLAELAKVRRPILVIQGGKDFQVDPELDFGPVKQTIESSRNLTGEARLLPGLDHLLKPEPGQSRVGHYSDLYRRVDPAAIQAIVDWVSKTTDGAR